ncbi:MAG: Enoyl-[acyl-carrier-protein] reductase [Chlorobi bacterium]|nr:Enoyl-[acyl-carrier-protein] reductase [Chlorobiota bacterium]
MSEKKSYGLLKGKRGIVFGPLDESSIGWQIALSAYGEGATLAISNVQIALRVGKVMELAKLCGDAPVIACDATNNEEIDAAFKQLKEEFGPVDFIIHSIGMSQNIRKSLPYEALNYDWYLRTLDVSAVSLHRILTSALKNDAIKNGGSVVAMTYIAAQRNYSSYSDMGDAKSLLESIARSYGTRLAERGIRINTVSQSPTYTRAGSGIENFDKMYDYADRVSPLGNASAEECGDYVVTLLSDLTRKVTMQNLYHDGGYSSMGMTIPMLHLFHAALQNEELAKEAGL